MPGEGLISNAALGDEGETAPAAPLAKSDEIAYEGHEKGGVSSGKAVFVYSNGFPRPYKNDKEEIEECKKRPSSWMPHNDDFKETMLLTRSQCRKKKIPCEFITAKKIEEFFGGLESVKGQIERIVVLAHTNSEGVFLNQNELNRGRPTIAGSDLSKWLGTIGKIREKFIKDTTAVHLIGCHAALDIYFLEALADSFGVCVRAFGEEVKACLNWDQAETKVTCRGRLAPASNIKHESDYTDCTTDTWYQGIAEMIPPIRICPKKQTEPAYEGQDRG